MAQIDDIKIISVQDVKDWIGIDSDMVQEDAKIQNLILYATSQIKLAAGVDCSTLEAGSSMGCIAAQIIRDICFAKYWGRDGELKHLQAGIGKALCLLDYGGE